MTVRSSICLLLALVCVQGFAKDLKVPQQYPTIQAAIDAASDGDRVLIASGIYKGNGNVELDFEGKAITVQGDGYLSTIIDGEQRYQGFIFHSGEGAKSILRSLTVKRCRSSCGAALSISGASPLIFACNFEDNGSTSGGAVYITNSNARFDTVTFNRNSSTGSGGAVYTDGASPIFLSCAFRYNGAKGFGGSVACHYGKPLFKACSFRDGNSDFGGGGLAADSSEVTLRNCTLNENSALQNAGAVDLSGTSSLYAMNCTIAANLSHRGDAAFRVTATSQCKIWNSILWCDVPGEIQGNATVGYSCLSGGYRGINNTADDPKIVDAISGDLHLLIGSPCIDKAELGAIADKEDLDGRDRISGAAPDMGAYEFPLGKPAPATNTERTTTYTVPHDGNPSTDTVQIHLIASGYDQLGGTLSFLWQVDNEDVSSSRDLYMKLEPGKKRFDCIVRSSDGNFTKFSTYVTVLPEPNKAPLAYAGEDLTVKAVGGTAHVLLHGRGSDPDGDTLSYLWSTGATTQDVGLDLAPGIYSYTLTVTDPYGAKSSSTVRVHVLDTEPPIVVLNGSTPMSLEVFSPWVDPGATAHDAIDGSDLAVTVSGIVNNKKLGTYVLTYSATDNSGNRGTAQRTVIVKDTTAPVITLKGDNPMTVDCGKGYSEPGATATDNYDGSLPVSISGTVPSTTGTYTVTYTATDSSGNTATATRTVIVKGTAAPIITLNGSNPMTVECGSGYTEPGATATSGCSGASLPVTISGTVSSTAGTYTITYSATDSDGSTSTATRKVVVSDSTPPVITLNGANPMTVECGTGYSEPGATATDVCDGSSITVSISGTVPNRLGSYTVTYTATDKAGNKATATRTVTVKDTQAPTITLNGSNPMNVECGSGYVEPGATATDGCDGVAIPVTITGTVNSTKGTYTVTYTATDASGNKTTVTRTVKVVDTTAPVITLNGLPTVTVECGQGYTELGAMAIDVCDGPVSVTTSGTVSSAKGTYTVTYTATDSSGNKASATRTVIVADTTGPNITINGPNPATVECGSGYVELGATATDGCDSGSVPVVITGSVPTSKGTYIVTYKATDSSGNTATATRTVNVVDTTAPVITLNGSNPMTVECGSGYVEPGATATDVCDGSVTVVVTGSVLTSKGTYTVTYKATDSSGNSSTKTRTVNVTDSTAPVITLNGANPMTVECGTGYVEPGATATDGCDGNNLPVTITGTVLTSKGTYTVTYKATDSAGNVATKTRTVNVTDTVAPVVTLNGSNPMTVQCGSGYVEPGATANDACDGALTVSITGSVLSSKGTYTVTYKATDSSGNVTTKTRTVNVVDTTAPVITLNGSSPMTVECGTGYSEPGATANDICDGSLPVTITGSVLSSKGTYAITYKATDSSGNTATQTRTVNVVDTSAPALTLNGANPMTVQCGSGYSEPGGTAIDACDGSLTVTITGSVLTSKGTYTVTYKATDSSGNSSTKTRTVNVVDTTAPVITLNGSSPMTVECGSGYVEPGATSTDACDGTVSVVITGSVLTSKGSYTITYKATDSSGNTATKTRTVNVVDTTAPVITLNGSNPMTVECGTGYVEPGATASDVCDGSVSVVITGSVPATKGTYTVTYKATDSSGNSTTKTRTVNVVDTKSPVITLNGSNPMTVDLASGTYVEPGATATDSCDGSVSVTISGTVASVIGTYTVTYTAKDSSGNTATATRTVNVISTAGPTITGLTASPGSLNSQNQRMKTITLTYTVTDPADPAPTITVTATSSDADSGVFVGDLPGDIVINSTTSVDLRQEHAPGKTRTYTITVKVTDKNGKTATASVNVIAQ